MPIYEYQCPKCRETFEELRRSVDDDVAPCPVCGEPSPRIISNSAFILKGGGWYATTYKDRRPEFIQRGGRPKIKGVSVETDEAPAASPASAPASAPAGTGGAPEKTAETVKASKTPAAPKAAKPAKAKKAGAEDKPAAKDVS